MLHTVNGYEFTCLPLRNISELKADWLNLEKVSNNYFFLSWAWIGTWIEAYAPELDVLRAFYNGEIVGIATLVHSEEHRHYFLKSRSLYINQTGNPSKDQIWIEYNDILTHKSHENQIASASIQYLIHYHSCWDELIVSAISEQTVSLLKRDDKLLRHDLWGAPCYGVNLKKHRELNQEYLSNLSRNTRYQINRSIRKYSNIGSIIIETATSTDIALDYFSQIAPLHIKRWGDKPGESGFANKHFIVFHEKLITKYWEQGLLDLIRIKVSGRIIALFYNFIYGNRVYFYLSGLVSESDKTLKPGLMGHTFCINKYINEGRDFYDFMGGDERYKSSLGFKHHDIIKVALQKPMLKFRLEKIGRKIKKHWK